MRDLWHVEGEVYTGAILKPGLVQKLGMGHKIEFGIDGSKHEANHN